MRSVPRERPGLFAAAASGVVVTGLLVSGPAWPEEIETVHKSFTVSGTPDIYVRNVDGRTRVVSHESAVVEVQAVKEVLRAGSKSQAERAAREVEVRIEQVGNRIEVETKYPKRIFSFGVGPEVLVHIDVRAPRSSNLDAKTVDGPLETEGFEGEHRLASVDGDIRAESCSGRLHAEAVDGDIEIAGIRGDVEARTVDGDVRVEGRLGAVKAHSTDGDVSIRVEPDSTMTRDWSVRTTDGSVEISLPEGFGAELQLETADGHIECMHPLTMEGKISHHKVQGSLYGGGRLLQVRTSDGSVRLTR